MSRWGNNHVESEEEESDGYDSGYDEKPDTSRNKLHWSTPRVPEFKRVLGPAIYDEREHAEAEREHEAKEAWKAVSSLAGDAPAGSRQGGEEQSDPVNNSIEAGALKNILSSFDLKVNLSEIGLDGSTDASGKEIISFEKFREFTSLTPRDREEEMAKGRSVGGTRQMHPGSPIKHARPLA